MGQKIKISIFLFRQSQSPQALPHLEEDTLCAQTGRTCPYIGGPIMRASLSHSPHWSLEFDSSFVISPSSFTSAPRLPFEPLTFRLLTSAVQHPAAISRKTLTPRETAKVVGGYEE